MVGVRPVCQILDAGAIVGVNLTVTCGGLAADQVDGSSNSLGDVAGIRHLAGAPEEFGDSVRDALRGAAPAGLGTAFARAWRFIASVQPCSLETSNHVLMCPGDPWERGRHRVCVITISVEMMGARTSSKCRETVGEPVTGEHGWCVVAEQERAWQFRDERALCRLEDHLSLDGGSVWRGHCWMTSKSDGRL